MLLLALLINMSVASAQAVSVAPSADGNKQSAGFAFTTNGFDANSKPLAKPLIHYRQHIHMLSATNDMPSLRIFGDGQVLVHYPAYMKKAGDYRMQLEQDELIRLLRSLSSDGLMDFDEDNTRKTIDAKRRALKAKGRFYAVSDAVETIVDIHLDEYQKNKASRRIKNFHKRFKWKNIEHDAARYRDINGITGANSSVTRLKDLMKDARLTKTEHTRNP